MRPYCFLLVSLLGVACAPHVAHAAPPTPPSPPAPPHAMGPDGVVDEVLNAKANGRVDIHAFAGSVRVTGWAQNQLKVHASVHDGCRVDIVPSGERYEIRLECDHGPRSADLEIQVPQGSAVEVRTLSADLTVQGVSGSLRLESVTSDIDVKGGASTDIEARTTSGSVHIDAATPQVRAQSVSGDVRITGARGKADIHTVSGDCTLSGGDFGDVRFETVSGQVTFTGGVVGSFEVQSHSGDVAVHLPATTNADVELR